jgi:asparagine synthase (glutamine-hydrolysing)
MCGIAGMFDRRVDRAGLALMTGSQRHRGPDAEGAWFSPSGRAALGHRRLSIIDLSDAGRQPMSDATGRFWITFNGEIYNYLELRAGLKDGGPFRTQTDTEVLLAAYVRWGRACLDKLIGMFAFAIWDEREQTLFAARDRFGVKPLYLAEPEEGALLLASEIKALHAAGVPRETDPVAWSAYLRDGMYDHTERTFWRGVRQLPPGGWMEWSESGGARTGTWYDPAGRAQQAGPDTRSDDVVAEELRALLTDSVRLRFRADVPVGVCLSGGLDSSLLLGLVRAAQGAKSQVKTFTFYCGDPAYDETPWVEQMLARTGHAANFCLLTAKEVPDLAARAQSYQDEPFGGLPTLGMAKVHERARQEGVTVLLDGNGLDEGWAGYDYYARAGQVDAAAGPVQGAKSRATLPECLVPEFSGLAGKFSAPRPFGDALLDLQYRDLRFSKIPRAMRFADRVSMMHSRELREPFLDHRVVELGLRQPAQRKIRDGQGKWLARRVAASLLPEGVREAPKRPVQTPQREWLRGPLRDWANDHIDAALAAHEGRWLDGKQVRRAWSDYQAHGADNSFPVWQWVNLGLMERMAVV